MPAEPSVYADIRSSLSAKASAAPAQRSLVGIFLFGGADSHNMLVPIDGANRTSYESVRPSPASGVTTLTFPTTLSGVGVGETPVNQLNSDTGRRWRLHPKLANLKTYYHDLNGLAVVRNVGTLNRPTTRTEYLANQNQIRPQSLFAHNIQQDIWQAALRHRELRTTGWFGRLANVVDPVFNPSTLVQTGNFSTGGNRLQMFPYGSGVGNIVMPSLMQSGTNYTGTTPASVEFWKMYHGDQQSDPTIPSNGVLPTNPNITNNGIHIALSYNLISSISAQRRLNTNTLTLPGGYDAAFDALPNITDGFGVSRTNAFRVVLRNACRIIWSRNQTSGAEYEQRRQTIMISVGGWDNHLSLRANMDWLLQSLDEALLVYYDFLNSYTVPGTATPLAETVCTFTETEFSRTLRANTTYGTDHAWAGHMFVFGPSTIINKGFYGPEPDYTINGGRDVDTGLGRFIPDISTDQYYATLAKWYAPFTDNELEILFPNLANFGEKTLGFLKP